MWVYQEDETDGYKYSRSGVLYRSVTHTSGGYHITTSSLAKYWSQLRLSPQCPPNLAPINAIHTLKESLPDPTNLDVFALNKKEEMLYVLGTTEKDEPDPQPFSESEADRFVYEQITTLGLEASWICMADHELDD